MAGGKLTVQAARTKVVESGQECGLKGRHVALLTLRQRARPFLGSRLLLLQRKQLCAQTQKNN
jgi:hypothetical protein